MKQESESSSGNEKVVSLPGAGGGSNTPWGKPEKRQQEAPAPPPVWTRYIDSRLKQFCAR